MRVPLVRLWVVRAFEHSQATGNVGFPLRTAAKHAKAVAEPGQLIGQRRVGSDHRQSHQPGTVEFFDVFCYALFELLGPNRTAKRADARIATTCGPD